MISRSTSAKALCLASSTVILLAASQLTSAPPPIELEGAGEALQARMGSSFADMSAGSLTAQTVDDTTPEAAPPEVVDAETPKELAEQTPPEQAAPAKVAETQAAQTVTQTQPQQPTQDVLRSQTQTLTSVQTTSAPARAAVSAQAVPLAATPVTADPVLPSVQPLAPATPTLSSDVVQSDPQLETLAAVERQTAAPATAMRPVRRDHVKAAKVAAARPKPKTTKPRTTPARQKPKAGNAKRNNTQGVESGSQTAKARTQGTQRKKARQAGNAAASNYPGLVMRRIARVPKPRVNNRGTAVIAFSVSSSGGLAGASVARSSGSKRLDQAALRVIRQAAPFPRPPAGAQRRFSIRIKGR